MSEIVKTSKVIVAGINVNIFSYTDLSKTGRSIAVLFLLHGRLGSAKSVERMAHQILEQTNSQGSTNKDLLIVTIDHRNHGTRLVNLEANNDWKDQNARHAVDMYAIQVGTASDVSFLIDFLPAYLFPYGQREIQSWMVAGISLGGHSTWILLHKEPRIKLGVPIIGCPNYLAVMGPRAEASSYSVSPPHFPPALIEYIGKHDPSSVDCSSNDSVINPFLGKNVLVLSGGMDKLVPWSASNDFVDKLYTGDGVKKVIVEENAGHECTPQMVQELCTFVWEHSLKATLRPAL